MAVTVDWANKVITISKGDSVLTQTQITPTEIYTLDTLALKATLRALEDSAIGMAFTRILKHNSAVIVGGVQLAPVIEIVNGYTVTFDDTNSAPYAVNLNGSNNNIADVTNVNTVSVRPSNSAGLIQTSEIQYASFQNGVTINVTSGQAGTTFPIGTKESPVNNITDALFIANLRGFDVFHVKGNIVVADEDVSNITFEGDSQTKTAIVLQDLALTNGCEFKDATITGTLDGNSSVEKCYVLALNYVEGYLIDCLLAPETTVLGGNNTKTAYYINCGSGLPGVGGEPTIDMGDTDANNTIGMNLVMLNHAGHIKLQNKYDPTSRVRIGLNHGHVIIDSTVQAGSIKLSGVGTYSHTQTGTEVIDDSSLLNPATLGTDAMSGVVETNGNITAKQALSLLLAAETGVYDAQTDVFKDPTGTDVRIDSSSDKDGNRGVSTLTPSP